MKKENRILTQEEILESQKSFEIIKQEHDKLEKLGFKFTLL